MSYALSIGADDDFAIVGAYAMQGQVLLRSLNAMHVHLIACPQVLVWVDSLPQEVIFDRANSRIGFAPASSPC